MGWPEFAQAVETQVGSPIDAWEPYAAELIAVCRVIQASEWLPWIIEHAAGKGTEYLLAALGPVAAAAGVGSVEAVAAILASLAASPGVRAGIWAIDTSATEHAS